MPVSPQDFDLYSRVTGTPMPSDAMSRMRMAPDVYKFTKDFARKPNLLEKTGNLVKTVGKIGLRGLGEGFRQSQDNEARALSEQLRNQTAKSDVAEANMDESPEQVAPAPALTAVEKGEIAKQKTIRTKTDEMIRLEEVRAKLRQKNQEKAENLETYSIPASQEPLKDPSTIDYISKKTGEDMHEYFREKTKIIDDLDAKKESLRQQPTTADTYGQDYVANQSAANIVDRSLEQGSEMADETPTVSEVLSESQDSQPADDMIGASPTSKKIGSFLGRKGIDKLLFAAMSQRGQQDELIEDDSPLVDHPDLPGGEEPNLPSGTNTSSTEDLSDFHKEMRKMNAEERVKEMAPSEKQVKLSEESIRLGSNYGIPNKTDMEQIRKDPEYIAAQESMKPKSTTEKANDLIQFVQGSRTDLIPGRFKGKSMGVSYIPETNGSPQVAFNILDKPSDQTPTKVQAMSFGVDKSGSEYLQNQMSPDTFGTYANRAFREAKEGKQRKAGEIFAFIPEQKRIIPMEFPLQ